MKIVITGAESSGKTTLISDLADHYETSFTKEYARGYLIAKGGKYDYSDLLIIARGQYESIMEDQKTLSQIHLADTDLLTIKIWSEYKYGKCDQWIDQKLIENKPDLYLLCKPDIPWVSDPLRENPEGREELYRIYQDEIKVLGVPSVELSGSEDHRLALAIRSIEALKKIN